MSIEIEYLGRTTSVEKSPTFDEFVQQIVKKFFITEKMRKTMSIMYRDEDDDQIFLGDENYDDISEVSKLYLNIEERQSNEESDTSVDTSKIAEIVEKKMKSIIQEIEDYKIKLRKICQTEVSKKLEEVDNKHLKELKELKDFYEKKLTSMKDENDRIIREFLTDMEGNSFEKLNQKLEEYHKNMDNEIEKMMKEKEKSMREKVNEINFKSLEENQNEIVSVIEKNQKELDNALNK